MDLFTQRIKSFTLIEVLIAIIIASLAVGFSMTILIKLQHLFNQKLKYDEQIEELNSFILVFKNDINASCEIHSREETLQILKDTIIIGYSFPPEMVIRNNIYQSDTFRIRYSGIKITYVQDCKGLVKDIEILLNDKFIKYLFFYKDYKPETLYKYSQQEYVH